jgi:hypothetical protein
MMSCVKFTDLRMMGMDKVLLCDVSDILVWLPATQSARTGKLMMIIYFDAATMRFYVSSVQKSRYFQFIIVARRYGTAGMIQPSSNPRHAPLKQVSDVFA